MGNFKATVIDEQLELETSLPLFSPDKVDKGTLTMLSILELNQSDKLLDLGCGYGVVGIYAAKKIGTSNVVMVDNDKLAVHFAKINALKNNLTNMRIIQSDAYDNIDDTAFTLILSNPPYHADFKVPKKFIEKGFNRLAIGGKFYMVTKRREWYEKKFTSIFGGVKVQQINDYFIFIAIKKSIDYAKKRR